MRSWYWVSGREDSLWGQAPSLCIAGAERLRKDDAGADASRADIAVLIVAADAAVPSSPDTFESWRTILSGAAKVIVLVNKMYGARDMPDVNLSRVIVQC